MRRSILNPIIICIGSVFLLSMSYNASNPQDKWVVPEEYDKMENPYSGIVDKEGIGEEIYGLYCLTCHGEEGKGDGVNAILLETSAADFSAESFKTQSDGSLFYKIATGRNEMPNFEVIITEEEDLWLVVNYLRKF